MAEELASRAALAVDNARLFREAEESLGLLDALFATAPVGLAFYDRDLRYLKINETLAALNGVPAEEHIGRTAGQVIPAIAEKVEPLLRSVLESGEPVLGKELRGATAATPEERYWLASYYPVRSGDGEMIGVGAVVADLTERTRGQLRLAAQYEVTRILSSVASFDEAAEAGARGDVRQARLVDRRDLDGLRRRHSAHARRLLRARGRPGQLRRRCSRSGPRGRLGSSRARRQLRARHLGRGSARGRTLRSPGQRGGHRPAIRLRLPRLPRVDRVRGCRVLQSSERRQPDDDLLAMTAALGSQIGQFIERTRAEEATERARRRLTFLAEASRVLSSSLEFDVTLQRITELAVPMLADWCGVSTLDADGQLSQVAIAHVDQGKIRWARELAERYPADPESEYGAYAVMRSRESLLMPVISQEI